MFKHDELFDLSDLEYAKKLMAWWGLWLDQSGDFSGLGSSGVSGAYSHTGAGHVGFAPVSARDPYAERVHTLMDDMKVMDDLTAQYLALVFTYDKKLTVQESCKELGDVKERQFKTYKREGLIYMAGRLGATRVQRLAS